MQRVVIIGGGVAGVVMANHLARHAEDLISAGRLEITLISDKPDHVYQPAFLYMAFKPMPQAEFRRPLREVLTDKVKLKLARVEKVDPAGRTVTLAGGETVPYDHLTIATGSRPVPEEIPGLVEAGDWFYTEEGATRLREKLLHYKGGGNIVVSVAGLPHKCPVAPLEITLMLQEWLAQRGLAASTKVHYTYPIGRVYGVAPVADWAEKRFAEMGTEVHTYFNVERVDPDRQVLMSLEEEEIPFDILIAIPPHKGAPFIEASGLGENGWIPTDKHTLKYTGDERITVLGDTTNIPTSKAGSTAHFEAEVAAKNLDAELRGLPAPERYTGKVFCFIESGLDKATFIEFAYDRAPSPPPPSKTAHWAKKTYNKAYWLTAKGLV